jgi:hypothetical protein
MTPSLSLKRFALTTFVVLLVVAPFILGRAVAAPQLVNWGATQVVSKSPSQTNAYPTVDYDSNGKIHVAWIEYGSDPLGSDSRVLYTNNVNGTWISPFEVSSSGGRGVEPLVDLKVIGNELHFLYFTNSKQVAHRLVTLNGATPSKGPVTTMTSTKGGNPELVVDGSGNLHAFYISRSSDSAPYQIYHRIRTNSWGSARVVRPDGTQQKFPAAAATSDGKIHLAFLGNAGDVVRYSIFGGSTWQASTDIASGKMKQVHITTDGATIYTMYSGQPGNYHNVYFTQGGNGLWTTPVLLSSGGSYDENPFPYFDRSLNTLFAFWASGGGTSNTRVVVREYVPGSGFGEVVSLGGVAVQWPRAAGNLGSVSVAWEDKVTRTYDARLRTGTGTSVGPTPTPIATVVPTVVPVDFAFARTTPSPTKNANVGVSITNPQGSPNQMRYSLTPFTADNSALAWQDLPNGGVTAFNVDTSAAVLNCSVTIYAQVRNSANGTVSPVRTVSAVVDTEVQSQATLDPLEFHTGAGTIIGQPNAPVGLDPDYTRNPAFYYRFTQEPAPCAGLKSYQLESNSPTSPTPFPNVVEGSTNYGAPNTSPDANGVGWPEQTLEANLTLTDIVDNVESFSKAVTYDDDPPVLGAGGIVTFTTSVSTNLSLVPIQFDASVTDDGYTNAAPANKKYWGVWVVATNSPTMPSAQVFAQYGKAHILDAGATSLKGVNLTNDSPDMRTGGTRYVHLRFLDGAGNYSVAGITSPPITLTEPFVDGTRIYMPLVSN